MQRVPRLIASSAILSCVVSVLPGCAGGGSSEPVSGTPAPGESNVIPISVNNNLSPRTSVTVRLINDGVIRILGGVGGGAERTFDVGSPGLTGQHRLSATGTGLDQEVLSQPFTLSANSTVGWTLAGNSLLVGERLGEPLEQRNREP